MRGTRLLCVNDLTVAIISHLLSHRHKCMYINLASFLLEQWRGYDNLSLLQSLWLAIHWQQAAHCFMQMQFDTTSYASSLEGRIRQRRLFSVNLWSCFVLLEGLLWNGGAIIYLQSVPSWVIDRFCPTLSMFHSFPSETHSNLTTRTW